MVEPGWCLTSNVSEQRPCAPSITQRWAVGTLCRAPHLPAGPRRQWPTAFPTGRRRRGDCRGRPGLSLQLASSSSRPPTAGADSEQRGRSSAPTQGVWHATGGRRAAGHGTGAPAGPRASVFLSYGSPIPAAFQNVGCAANSCHYHTKGLTPKRLWESCPARRARRNPWPQTAPVPALHRHFSQRAPRAARGLSDHVAGPHTAARPQASRCLGDPPAATCPPHDRI